MDVVSETINRAKASPCASSGPPAPVSPRRPPESVAEYGLAGATVEQIAAAAEVGRATFFRYFSSKEDAVAEGMTTHWLDLDHRGDRRGSRRSCRPTEAVVAAFDDLGDGFDAISGQVRELATLTRSSPALSAWTLQIYLRYEAAIAALVAPRARHRLAAEDPRPRLIGALAMASVRIALDDWLVHGGSLPCAGARSAVGTARRVDASALEQLRTGADQSFPAGGAADQLAISGRSRSRKPVRR